MFVSDCGLWRVQSLTEPMSAVHPAELFSRALDALLDHVDPNPTCPQSMTQVQNCIRLARACAADRPKSTARVFLTLHKALKRLGDKRQILEVARLSIEAARRVGPDRPEGFVKYEAQALICGESWVYQRIARLADALGAAQKSLQLGEDIRWWRNTTFCRKCIGRLLRMHAESSLDPHEKAQTLSQSVSSLQDAIERFGSTEDGGPNYPEAGDCWSLLGRTYLVMGELAMAEVAVREARELLTNPAEKDYLDLLILRGELAAARGDRQEAEDVFSEALGVSVRGDAERTEMRARAFFQRARSRQAGRQRDAAIADYRHAAAIWRELGERDREAEAEWQVILLTEPPSSEVLARLGSETFPVRVLVIQQRREELSQLSASYRGRRGQAPGPQYWERLIAKAHEIDARQHIDW
jgi:tetratricopeptide (TPR) repeat protein